MKQIITMLAVLFSLQAQAKIIYVDSSATGNAMGNSWVNAYTTLQQGINASVNTDSIWIAKGTYFLTGSSMASFEFNGISLFGSFAGTETAVNQRNIALNPTILSGDINKDDIPIIEVGNAFRQENAHTVISIPSEGIKTVVDGLTVESGNSKGSNGPSRFGGAIAIWSMGTASGNRDVEIRNCTFRKNAAFYNSVSYVFNANIAASAGSVDVSYDKCTFYNNGSLASVFNATAISGNVNEVYNNCLIRDNIMQTTGTIWALDPSTPNTASTKILNTTVVNNITMDTTQFQRAVVTYLGNSNNIAKIELANNIFVQNSIATPVMRLYSYTANQVYLGANLFQDSSFSYTAYSNIVDAADIKYISKGAEVKFVNEALGDYRLARCSDAVDAGKISSVDPNVTIYTSFNVAGGDLVDSNRVVNALVDLGCYENQMAGQQFTLTFDGTDLNVPTGYTSYVWSRNTTVISGANTNSYTPTQNGNYEVTAYDTDSCEFTATYSLMNLAVQDFASAKISIYPNPVSNVLTIGLDNPGLKIIVRDMSGKVVTTSTENKINVEALSNGMYLLEAQQKGNRLLTKFIKE